MPRLRGTNVQNTTVRGHQAEDGYVLVGADGYTVVSTLMGDTLFSSFVRTGTGLWSATLKEANPGNCYFFRAEPQVHTGDSAICFQLLDDNVGVTGTTDNFVGGTPQVIHFKFFNPTTGSAADLPAHGGFKYMVGLPVSSAYYVKNY